jgi:hypothetical protein
VKYAVISHKYFQVENGWQAICAAGQHILAHLALCEVFVKL